MSGTASLEDIGGRVVKADTHNHNLKVNKNGIILQPQPSDSEDDPLNWPLWQRDLITMLLCLLAIIASTMSSMLACNTVTMIIWFGSLTVTQAAMLTGYHLLGVGLSGFFFVATAAGALALASLTADVIMAPACFANEIMSVRMLRRSTCQEHLAGSPIARGWRKTRLRSGVLGLPTVVMACRPGTKYA